MNEKALIFLDYNGTFDDVQDGKGAVLFHGLSKFDRIFRGNIQIVVITSALANGNFSIKSDLIVTLMHFPKFLQSRFAYLIEEDCKYLSKIENLKIKDTKEICSHDGTKRNGVELFFKNIPCGDITHCIFAGDDEKVDLGMLDANIGNCKKIMLLANRRAVVEQRHPLYKVNLNCAQVYDEMKNYIPDKNSPFIVKTTPQSYGVGKGFEAISQWIEKSKD